MFVGFLCFVLFFVLVFCLGCCFCGSLSFCVGLRVLFLGFVWSVFSFKNVLILFCCVFCGVCVCGFRLCFAGFLLR